MPRQKSWTYNHKEYQAEYQRGLKRVFLTFNPANDDDVRLYEYLKDKGNITGYIKELIRKDMKGEVAMRLFSGFSPDGRPVFITLEDGLVYITDNVTGEKITWNDEYYTEEAVQTIKLGLLNEGYRF